MISHKEMMGIIATEAVESLRVQDYPIHLMPFMDLWRHQASMYREMYFRFLQAKRDFPHLDHWGTEPAPPAIFSKTDTARIQRDCEREFNRTI